MTTGGKERTVDQIARRWVLHLRMTHSEPDGMIRVDRVELRRLCVAYLVLIEPGLFRFLRKFMRKLLWRD